MKYPATRPGACLILGMIWLRRFCCASSSLPDSMLTPTATAYTAPSSPPVNGEAILRVPATSGLRSGRAELEFSRPRRGGFVGLADRFKKLGRMAKPPRGGGRYEFEPVSWKVSRRLKGVQGP